MLIGTDVLARIANCEALMIGYRAYDSYATGTAYSLTASAAALAFGTANPSITIGVAGTYRLRGSGQLKYNGATFAANRTVTVKFRRVNNSAADLTNGSISQITSIVTALTAPFGYFVLPEIEYIASLNDTITLFGLVSVVPTLGSLDVVEASINAIRVA